MKTYVIRVDIFDANGDADNTERPLLVDSLNAGDDDYVEQYLQVRVRCTHPTWTHICGFIERF